MLMTSEFDLFLLVGSDYNIQRPYNIYEPSSEILGIGTSMPLNLDKVFRCT